jgi:glycosyltransferase involved in cell wall biosynthesis
MVLSIKDLLATCHCADNARMAENAPRESVALAHHWLVGMRGGEKVLAALAEMFPAAPIYTLIAQPEKLDAALRARRIETSWLQRFTWIKNIQRKALPLLPGASRSLDASAHDVVICSDAAMIKAVRSRPDALKICYCHSPMRYLYDLQETYRARAGIVDRLGLRFFAGRVRRADQAAAEGVTAFIANSRCVAQRIRRCYGRGSVVIYPPVNTDFPEPLDTLQNFYLVVGEHVSYKRNDLAIEACRQFGRWLVVIGSGPLLNEARRMADPQTHVMGWQSDEVVRDHLRRCRALLFCGEEDFGIVPVEAQAAGRPVIAYGAGGATETVVDGATGVLFREQTVESVIAAIKRFETSKDLLPPPAIQQHARQFSAARFREEFERFYRWCLELHRAGGPHRVQTAIEQGGVFD